MIDLQSDTVTEPDQRMRDAARDAAVGDDIYGEDPTVTELETRAAELVGKPAALFVPSGTMGNQIAIRVHADRGEELVVDSRSHIHLLEGAGAAQLSGVQSRTIDVGAEGIATPKQVRSAIVDPDLHRAGTGLLSIENSHNYLGGVAVPMDAVAATVEPARERGVPVHVDGARLFNAAVALKTPATELVAPADSVMFSFSKGLGAPIGSILAGPEPFIEESRRTRKLFGGGMRQVGIVAAPALLSLENIDRLEEDHENARKLASGLSELDGLSVPEPDTNIVLVDSERRGLSAEEVVERCKSVGVTAGTIGEYTTRFCTHLDVDAAAIDTAIECITSVLDD